MFKKTRTISVFDQQCQSEFDLAARRFGKKSAHPCRAVAWLKVMSEAFGHRSFLLEAQSECTTVGLLPLVEVKSVLFGRFLVSLPYINVCGVWANDSRVALALIDRAVSLADELDVRYLELRHETEIEHPALLHRRASKSFMRLALPETADELWKQFKSKRRSQIRSGMKHALSITWGRFELVDEFYKVFSQRMRDLGTPVYSKRLFKCILENFESSEICNVKSGRVTIASALLIHGDGTTEVPSASALPTHNRKNPNRLMYWHLLKRAIEHGNQVFDFGRSTVGSSTYRFKKQWGALPTRSVWQYYMRKGDCDQMRPENAGFSVAVKAWQKLPVALTRMVGPAIVRGIP